MPGLLNFTKEQGMSIHCDVILRPRATPEQLTAVGIALWRWCLRAAGDTGIYQFLDNEALAELIAGKIPVLGADHRGAAHLWVRDDISPDAQTSIDTLRRSIPALGIEDIVVDGTSWHGIEASESTCPTL
jgi:hypothetical protein